MSFFWHDDGFITHLPCLISRADAYQHLNGFDHGKVVETQTFADALVYLCVRPRAAANLDVLVHYERPPVPAVIDIDEAMERLGLGEGQNNEETEASTVSEVSTLTSSAAASHTIPDPPTQPHGEVESTSPRDNSKRARHLNKSILTGFSVDHIYMHVRNIRGEIIRTLTERPTTRVSTLSLGTYADLFADALGHTSSTILLIHQVFNEAAELKSPRRYFVNELVSQGMPRREASAYWEMMKKTPDIGGTFVRRNRMSLGVE